jgi:hypothetical protein
LKVQGFGKLKRTQRPILYAVEHNTSFFVAAWVVVIPSPEDRPETDQDNAARLVLVAIWASLREVLP